MNKAELAGEVKNILDITYDEAYSIVNTVIYAIRKGLKNDGIVRFVDFLSISVVPQKSKKVRDIKRGKQMIMPSRKRLKVSPGKSFKDYLDQPVEDGM